MKRYSVTIASLTVALAFCAGAPLYVYAQNQQQQPGQGQLVNPPGAPPAPKAAFSQLPDGTIVPNFPMTLPAGTNLPLPTPTTLGGVKSASAPAGQTQSGVDTSGNPTFAVLPSPGASQLGGVKSSTCALHQFQNQVDTSGNELCTQPAASDVSGLAAVATSGSATDLSTGTVAGARLPSSVNSFGPGQPNPSGTTSTSRVMMGLACTFTPNHNGVALITVSGTIANSTAGQGVQYELRFGTGGAPANAAALTGSSGSNPVTWNPPGAPVTSAPFSTTGVATGLVAGTTYWLDLALAAFSANTATATNLTCAVVAP